MNKTFLRWSLGLALITFVLPGCSHPRCWNCWWKNGQDCCASCQDGSDYRSSPRQSSEESAYREPKSGPAHSSAYSRKGWDDRNPKNRADDDGEPRSDRRTLGSPVAPTNYQGSARRSSLPPLVSSSRPKEAEERNNSDPEESFEHEEAEAPEENALDQLPAAPSIPPLPPELGE